MRDRCNKNSPFLSPSLARSREARFACPNRRACSQAITCFYLNAPINVKPAGVGWGFDIFQKFAFEFPAYGQIILVKCN